MAQFQPPPDAIEIAPIIKRAGGPPLPEGALEEFVEADPNAGAVERPPYAFGALSEAAEGSTRFVGGVGQALSGVAGLSPTEVGKGALEAGLGLSQTSNALITPLQQRFGDFLKGLVEKIPGMKGSKIAEGAGVVGEIGSGLAITPGAVAGGIKGVEAIARRIPHSKPLREIVQQGIDEVSGALPSTKISIPRAGEEFQSIYNKRFLQRKAEVDAAYEIMRKRVPSTATKEPTAMFNAVEELTSELKSKHGVAPSPAQKTAGQMTPKVTEAEKQAEAQVRGLANAQGMISGMPIEDFIQKHGLGAKDKQWTFHGLDAVLRDIRELRRGAIRNSQDNTARQFKILEKGVERSMREFDADFPGVKAAMDSADTLNREIYAPFFSKRAFTRKAANENPEDIVDFVIKRNNITQIREVKDMIGNVKTWQRVSKSWWDNLVNEATQGGELNVKQFVNGIRSYTPEVRREVLGLRIAGKNGPLDELVETIEKIEKTAPAIFTPHMGPAGTGFGVVRIVGAVFANRPVEAATRAGSLIITPIALSKILNNEKGLKLLNEGFKVMPGTRRAAHISAELSNIITTSERQFRDGPSSESP